MPADVWRHTRGPRASGLTKPPAAVTAAGMRLVLTGEGALVGPPFGSVRYPARWFASGATGPASVEIRPFWSWGSEVEVHLVGPRSIHGRLLVPARRLGRAADRLAATLAAGVGERPALPARTARRSPASARLAGAR